MNIDLHTMKTLSLNGQWRMRYHSLRTVSYEAAIEKFLEGSLTYQVPGDVHTALIDAGIIKEPLVGTSSIECDWMSDLEYWMFKEFEVSDDFMGREMILSFEGLDLTAEIWLNGNLIGTHNNAFVECEIDISSALIIGKNLLVVRIDEGIESVKDKPTKLMDLSWNNLQPYRAWMRKPQYVYSWDWTVLLPSCGIWKDVTIKSYKQAYIEDVYLRTTLLNNEGDTRSQGVITADIRISKKHNDINNYTLVCEIYGDPRYTIDREPIVLQKVKVSGQSCEMKLCIDKPNLWWPNQSGDPYLYKVIVKLLLDECSVNEVSMNHGLRKVALVQNELGEGETSFTFYINDEPIFAKGANHVPADSLPGRVTDEKITQLLEAAAHANMNMIRVWGGGYYESDHFMDTCDRLGILVWHDFMYACGFYPDFDPEFYENVREESIRVIKRMRNHASLIGWSGNNEIQGMYRSCLNRDPHLPWYGGKIFEELLPGLVSELDRDRIYRESSPHGYDGPEGPDSFESGDQHYWRFTHNPGWVNYLDLWRFTDYDYKFLSEFGIIGAMNIESARKCIAPDKMHIHSDEWLHHTNSSSNHNLLEMVMNTYFEDVSKMPIQEFILKSQVIQAEIMKHIYDELRIRKFRCSGVLLWTLSDSMGIHNWSVIDYYLGKRPVYHYLKRSMAPLTVIIKGFEAQNFQGMKAYTSYFNESPESYSIYASNDSRDEKDVKIECVVTTFEGVELKRTQWESSLRKNSTSLKMPFEIDDIKNQIEPTKTLINARIYEKEAEDWSFKNECRLFMAPYQALALEEARIICEIKIINTQQVALTIWSDTFVWMLHIATPEGVEPFDNDIDLYVGEKRYIVVKVKDAMNYTPELLSLNPSMKIEVHQI